MEGNREEIREEIVGLITKKEASERGPKGHFGVYDTKLACWDSDMFSKYQIGDEVKVTYTSKENEYNGRIYYNKNISYMTFKNKGDVPFTNEEKETLEEEGVDISKMKGPKKILKSENGVVKLGGIFYRIKDIELELLE
jgi:hypothetical protein